MNADCQARLRLINSYGLETVIFEGSLTVGTYSEVVVAELPTGYEGIFFEAWVGNNHYFDSLDICVVYDYVKFRGKVLEYLPTYGSGEYWQIEVEEVLSDPSGKLELGENLRVHRYNNPLISVPYGSKKGDHVEVYGGYVGQYTTFSVLDINVSLGNPEHYMKGEVKFRGTVRDFPDFVGAAGEYGVNVEINEIFDDPTLRLKIGDIATVTWPVTPYLKVFAVGDKVDVYGYYETKEKPDWWSKTGKHWIRLEISNHYVRKAESSVDWRMFMHDTQHTGYTEGEGPDVLDLVWEYPLTNWTYSGPVIASGRVYVSAIGRLICLDAETGMLLWENDNVSLGYYSQLAVEGGRLYVTNGYFNNQLICLDAYSGKILWNNSIPTRGDYPPFPTVAYGAVYVKADNYVYCFNSDNGKIVWSTCIKRSYSLPLISVAYGRVYVVGGFESYWRSTFDDVLYCLDAYTGSILWEKSLPIEPVWYKWGSYGPIVSDGRLYIVKNQLIHTDIFLSPGKYAIVCLDAYSGDVVWDGETLGCHFGSMSQQ